MNDIVCGDCGNKIDVSMTNAIVTGCCPFCGAYFTERYPGLQSFFSGLSTMFDGKVPSKETLAILMTFVISPDIEERIKFILNHSKIIAEVFDVWGQKMEEDIEVRSSSTSVAPQAGSVKVAAKQSRVASAEPSKKVRRVSRTNDTSSDNVRDEDGSASTVGGSRLYISEDAIEGLPAEFRERARLVSSDEELNALIKDVAMGNP